MIPAAEGVPDGVSSILLDRGVLGVCVLVLGAFAWWLIRREAARADKADEQLAELNKSIRDDLLPEVVRAAQQHAAVTALLTKIGELLPDVASALRGYDRGGR
jgi:hypothetical protein